MIVTFRVDRTLADLRHPDIVDRTLRHGPAHVAASDGRSIPLRPDAWTPPTQHHPSKRFARSHEPELVDYTEAGATERGSMHQRPARRPDLQRYTRRRVEQENWAPRDEDSSEPYRHEAVFENNWQTTWERSRGPAHAGNPQIFQVVRRSR